MGYVQHDIQPAVNFEIERFNFPIPEGILYSLLIFIPEKISDREQDFAEIGIMSEVDDLASPLAVLCSGQFGSTGSLAWTGRHPIVTDNFLFVRLAGKTYVHYRLSYLFLKPSEKKTSMEVLDA